MAELLRDTPDWYTTTTFPTMVEDADPDAIVVAAEGWGGGAAWSGSVEGSWAIWFHQRANQSNGFCIGHHLRVEAYPSAEVELAGVTDYLKALQCCATIDDNGLLRIRKGNKTGTLLAGPTADAVPLNTDLSFGIKGVVDPVIGSFEVWYGDRNDLTNVSTGWMVRLRVNTVDTQDGVNGFWSGYYMGLNPDIFSSHLYMRDARESEGGLIDFSPGYFVVVKFPTADGIYTGWRPDTGSTRHSRVDEADHDGDTSYIAAFEVDYDNSYSLVMQTLAATSVVYGVDLITIAEATPDGAAANAVFSSTVVHDASGVATPIDRPWVSLFDSVYRCVRECFPINLKTGDPWTRNEVNGCEWGGTIPSV